jgi:ADP-ribose pyrophosphatase
MRETTQRPQSIEDEGIVHENLNLQVRKVVAHFEGFDKEYYVSDYGRRAAVLVVKDGRVLLVRQYRLVIDDLALEIPGGRVDDGESPEDAACRECLEETGVACGQLGTLVSYNLGLDTVDNYTSIFVAENCEESTDASAERFIWLPIDECVSMIFSGEIQDSLTIIALLAYARKR